MVSETSDKNSGPNFVIQNNIIKGPETKVDLKTHNIGEVILKNFNDKPDHVAQIEVETGKQTTFNEMKENSIRCALWMQKQGVGIGDVVAICTNNHLDAYIPCIGALITGAIYNPWHHEVPLKTAQHLMGLTRPKVIFACKSAVNVLQEAARLEKVDPRIIVFGTYPRLESLKDTMRLQTNEDVQAFEVPTIADPETIAMILFSSGTTGMPKGVAHSYNSLLKSIINFTILTSKKSINLWYSSLYWISGTFCMLQSIFTGATRVLHANFDPVETCEVIDKYKINWFFITPTMVTQWTKSEALKNYELNSLKIALTGGAKLSREILDEFKRQLPNVIFGQGYGMTELGGLALVQTDKCKRSDSVGFVTPNIQLKVVDINTGEVLGPNRPGELCVKSPTIMVGYYKNPSATRSTIDEEGWVHTGDKVYYEEDGEFYVVDRIKEVMKFRGHHVSPFEIEEILVGHPAVMEAAVVPVPHEIDLERPMAFVKKIPGSKVTEDELIELTSVLGDYKKLWGGVKFLDEIPLTASGKISRKELKEMAKMYSR